MHAWRFYQRLRLALYPPNSSVAVVSSFFSRERMVGAAAAHERNPSFSCSNVRRRGALNRPGNRHATRRIASSRHGARTGCRIDGCGHEGVPRSDRAPHRQLHQGEDRTGTLAPRYRTGEVVSSRSWLRARSDLPSTSKTSAIRRHSPAPRIQPPHPRLAHHTERLRISPNLDKNLV
jgi:hypothetical protein